MPLEIQAKRQNGKIMEVHANGIYLDSHYKVNSGDSDLRH
jgi:hypothetical protein